MAATPLMATIHTVGLRPVSGAVVVTPIAVGGLSAAWAAAGPWARRVGTRMRVASSTSQSKRFVHRMSMLNLSTKLRRALKIGGETGTYREGKNKVGRLFDGRRDRPVAWWQN